MLIIGWTAELGSESYIRPDGILRLACDASDVFVDLSGERGSDGWPIDLKRSTSC